MEYYLLHKDRILALFSLNISIEFSIFYSREINYLPLPLKRIIHNEEEFIKNKLNYNLELNEDGCFLFENWLFEREVPANREKIGNIGKSTINKRKIMLDNFALSLTDCYWVKPRDCEYSWEEATFHISKYLDTLMVMLKDNTRMYQGYNSTLGGQLEKFWYASLYNNKLSYKLCKRVEPMYDILAIREILATKIYESLNIVKYCKYDYVLNSEQNIVGCKCNVFTNDNLELVTAYDLLEELNLTQVGDVYNKIIERACYYGANLQDVKLYMDTQTIVDYLILNRDRHQGNIGFLRDSNSLKIICPAPIYDSGSSRHMEMQRPEGVLGTTVNGLYTTEDDCLSYVSDFSVVNTSRLINKNMYIQELNKSVSLSENRKRELVHLYEEKIKYIEGLQNSGK